MTVYCPGIDPKYMSLRFGFVKCIFWILGTFNFILNKYKLITNIQNI